MVALSSAMKVASEDSCPQISGRFWHRNCPSQIFDPTTKSKQLHDLPIDRQKIVSSGILENNDYDFIEGYQ